MFSYLAPGLPVSAIWSLVFMMLAMMYIQGAIEEAH
jgi:F0F1-type ATP synthase membrane subunit a